MDALIEKINQLESRFEQREPQILSYIPEPGRFQRLRMQAEGLAQKYPDPGNRPSLFGCLVGVKDIFHVDGFPTQAGSRLPAEILAGPQAESVTRLQEAGALIIGKTVTTEFAYFGPGPTRNPYNPAHTPGGSSSGSAAAAAAGLCDAALGTQTIGSVNRPAAFCGIFGYKPSHDRISKNGVIPLSVSFDHVGVLSARLETAADLAAVLCPDWRASGQLRKTVLGVPQGPYLANADTEGRQHFEANCEMLVEAGYSIQSVPLLDDFAAIVERHNLIVAAEAARVHRAWYAQFGSLYHPKTVELIETGMRISDQALQAARVAASKLRGEISAVMEHQQIDLWVSPSAPGPAPLGLESTGNPVMNLPWTQAGLPTLTVPSGINQDGLPLALQLTGDWYQDEDLFNRGAAVAHILNQP